MKPTLLALLLASAPDAGSTDIRDLPRMKRDFAWLCASEGTLLAAGPIVTDAHRAKLGPDALRYLGRAVEASTGQTRFFTLQAMASVYGLLPCRLALNSAKALLREFDARCQKSDATACADAKAARLIWEYVFGVPAPR